MEKTRSPDELIEELGGCGRYQTRLSFISHAMKLAVSWSVYTMAIVAKTPSWRCVDDFTDANMTSSSNSSSIDLLKSCTNTNGSVCERYEFDDGFNTVVSQFGLVCNNAFVPSTIMSIQTAGTFIGNPISGQVADLIGRKKPMYIALLLLSVFNLIGFFATDWIMLAVCRFFIGVGAGFYLTVQYSLASEFTIARWRPWVINFPSWPIQVSIYAFVAWVLSDWRYMQLTCCLVSVVFLFTWSCVPESFRWYLSHDRISEAEEIIKAVAKVNKRPVPDLTGFSLLDNKQENDQKTYSFLDLFKFRYLAKVTILCASNWFALGFISYGLLFGVQALSGNIFLNMFIFAIIGIPGKFAAAFLNNRIGRRKTLFISFMITGIGGFIAGIVQYIDTDYRNQLTNGFVMFANLGITSAWGSVQTMTIELYPTVIRNIGFGSQNTIARFGAILGPQIVFLEMFIPGVLYFMCGGICIVCIIALMFLPETVGGHLSDKLQDAELVIKPST